MRPAQAPRRDHWQSMIRAHEATSRPHQGAPASRPSPDLTRATDAPSLGAACSARAAAPEQTPKGPAPSPGTGCWRCRAAGQSSRGPFASLGFHHHRLQAMVTSTVQNRASNSHSRCVGIRGVCPAGATRLASGGDHQHHGDGQQGEPLRFRKCEQTVRPGMRVPGPGARTRPAPPASPRQP